MKFGFSSQCMWREKCFKLYPTLKIWTLSSHSLKDISSSHGAWYSCRKNNGVLTIQRRRQQRPTPVLLPGKSHGWRCLIGCSPWGHWGSDTTEWLHFHFSLSCTGEGNGNPLQCSCLENPRDEGAWWAAVSGVAQSRTRLKRLSSSSSWTVTSSV